MKVWKIESEKLSEEGHKEKYVRALAGKSVECEQDKSEQIWK